MSGWPRIYYKLLNLPLSVLVKSKSIPAEPAQELGLDTSRPIMYVLPYNSKADLMTLREQCLAHGGRWDPEYPAPRYRFLWRKLSPGQPFAWSDADLFPS